MQPTRESQGGFLISCKRKADMQKGFFYTVRDGGVELNVGRVIGVFSATLIAFVLFFNAFTVVDTGEVKVITQFGRVTGRVLEPGSHLKLPIAQGTLRYSTKKVTYETSTEESQKNSEADFKDYPVDTNTRDGQQVDVYYTIRFSVDPTKATYIAQNIGGEDALVEKIVKTESRIWARNIPREFEADQLYTGSVVEVQNKIADSLRPTFEANGIFLDSVGIREIKFSDEYVKAIEAKQIEAVKIETAKNQAEAAKFKKEQTITEAEADAERQRLLQQSLSGEVLQNKFYEKWDGKLPNVMSGESDLLLNVGQ